VHVLAIGEFVLPGTFLCLVILETANEREWTRIRL
jgi:hypothetical protein